jgi:hypothetical protein
MRSVTWFCVALAVAGVAGCKKEAKPSAKNGEKAVTATPKPGDPASTKDPKELAKPPEPKFPWSTDYSAQTAKLQGAWLVKDVGYLGSVQAWSVEGNKVTMFDPKKKAEQVGELIFEAPCELTLTVKTAGGSEGWGATLVVNGDTLHLGLGSGGVRNGDEIIACMSRGIYHLKGGECTLWNERFGEWETAKATCSFDDESFKGKAGEESEDELRFVAPNVLMTDQLAGNKPEKQADWAAAKAKADELTAKRPG